MLVKIDGRETMLHTCNGKSKKWQEQKTPVYIHDTYAYMEIDHRMEGIKYCPYCGVDIDCDRR